MGSYSQIGKVAIGSRLRQLSDHLTEDTAQIYKLYDVPADPRWFPVLYVLSNQESATITEIAQIIGQSHPSVSQVMKKMSSRGLASVRKGDEDARISLVSLSDEGKRLIPNFREQCADVAQAVEILLAEAHSDLWEAIGEVESLLVNKSLLDRVREVRKVRESLAVSIIDYRPAFQQDFARLNYEWIEAYFEIEETDRRSLDSPHEKIIEPGGYIFSALSDDEVVGTCALIKADEGVYELAKMAVAEIARGKGIGFRLGKAAIDKAQALNAKTVFLESNTVLKPAINLYRKLGFQKVVKEPSPYKRCNIQMELTYFS